jgi:hypothetical protein
MLLARADTDKAGAGMAASGRSIRHKFLRGAAAGYDGWVLVMLPLPEQEKLQRDIHSLTKVIKRTWA